MLLWQNLTFFEVILVAVRYHKHPMLSKVSNISDNDLEVYIGHLKQLSEEMLVRFHDLIQMDIPDWILDPSSSQVENIDVSLQESMIDLQSVHLVRARFRQGFHNLWLSIEVPSKYPLLWVNDKLFLTAFPTSYLVGLVSLVLINC